MTSSGCPILVTQQRSWRFLLRALKQQSCLRWLNQLPQDDLEKALVIPVAVARWITQFEPQLASNPTLNLVVAGAAPGPDTLADGRWYQLLPFLLGAPELKVTVALVGPNVYRDPTHSAFELHTAHEATAHLPKSLAVASLHPQTLGEFMKEQTHAPDLVILSHPGLEAESEAWLNTSELASVTDKSIPVGVLSYAADQFEMEQWAAVAYGYEVAPQVEENPFFRLPDVDVGLPVAISQQLWRISHGPSAGTANPEMMATLQEFMTVADAWIQAGEGELLPEVGRLLEEGEDLIFLPPVLCASLRTGELFVLDKNNLSLAPIQLPESLQVSRPTLADLPFARMAWGLKACQYLVEALS